MWRWRHPTISRDQDQNSHRARSRDSTRRIHPMWACIHQKSRGWPNDRAAESCNLRRSGVYHATDSPGRLTQWLECHLHTVEVTGSNPVPPIPSLLPAPPQAEIPVISASLVGRCTRCHSRISPKVHHVVHHLRPVGSAPRSPANNEPAHSLRYCPHEVCDLPARTLLSVASPCITSTTVPLLSAVSRGLCRGIVGR